MGCHVIDINPAALGADSITVMDFKRNVFTMQKKFSNLTPGSMDKVEMNQTGTNLKKLISGSTSQSAGYESWTPSYTTATLTWRS